MNDKGKYSSSNWDHGSELATRARYALAGLFIVGAASAIGWALLVTAILIWKPLS